MAARYRVDYIQTSDVGGPAAAGLARIIENLGNGIQHKTVIDLNGLLVTVGNTTGVSFGGTKFLDFPAGAINIKSVVVADIAFVLTNALNATPIDGTMGGDFSIGSTAPTDGTLTAADVDMLPSTSIDPISGGVADAKLAVPVNLGSRAAPLDAFFNILIDDADVANAASDVLGVTGKVIILWENGNYVE